MFQWLLQLKNGWYYLFLIVFSAVFLFFSNFFLTEILVFNVLSEQYTTAQIQQIIGFTKQWQWIGYVFIPFVVIIRVWYTAFCMYVGSLFQEYDWEWKKVFNIALKADVVFLFAMAVRFYYYVFINEPQTMEDMSVCFVSMLALVGLENTPAWLVSAYNSMSLFEVLYIALLTVLVSKVFDRKWYFSLIFVLCTYGLGTYLYVAGMTFLYLNFM